MDLNEKAVLRTILYADIFDCPLKKERLFSLVISPRKIPQNEIEKAADSLSKKRIIGTKGDFFYLLKRKNVVLKKIPQKKVINEKRVLALKAAEKLSGIPSIEFIGLSGGMASEIVCEEDDIDFFIIAEPFSLWTTRLAALLLLEAAGMRRRRDSKIEKNKICLNMFMAKDAMEFPKERHDIYTAYEVRQMVPLFSKNNTYIEFLTKNRWSGKFLANAMIQRPWKSVQEKEGQGMLTSFPMIQLAKFYQKVIMHRFKTTEIITDQLFAFHPKDYRMSVMKEYKKRLRDYSLL